MCAGGGGLHIFELDQHERTNISRIAIASGLVPFKVLVNQRWGLLAVLMRPRSSDPSACYQLQVMQLQTSGELCACHDSAFLQTTCPFPPVLQRHDACLHETLQANSSAVVRL